MRARLPVGVGRFGGCLMRTLLLVSREALDNLLWPRLTTWLFGSIVCVGLCVAYSSESTAVDQAISDELAFIRAGGYVYVLETVGEDDPAEIVNGLACERLDAVEDVRVSGSLSVARNVTMGGAPSETLGLVEASPGAVAVLGTIDPRFVAIEPSLILTEARLEALGRLPGSFDVAGGSHAGELTPAPIDVFGAGYARAVFVLTPPSSAQRERCVVATQQDAPSDVTNQLTAALGAPSVAARRVAEWEFGESPSDAYNSRLSRHSWWVLGLIAFVFRGLELWTRRADLGLYRTLGVGREALRGLLWVETTAIVAVASGLGYIAVSLALSTSPTGGAIATETSLAAAGSCLIGGWLASALYPVRDPLSMLKDR